MLLEANWLKSVDDLYTSSDVRIPLEVIDSAHLPHNREALNKNLKQAPRTLSPPNGFFHAKFIDEVLQVSFNAKEIIVHYTS